MQIPHMEYMNNHLIWYIYEAISQTVPPITPKAPLPSTASWPPLTSVPPPAPIPLVVHTAPVPPITPIPPCSSWIRRYCLTYNLLRTKNFYEDFSFTPSTFFLCANMCRYNWGKTEKKRLLNASRKGMRPLRPILRSQSSCKALLSIGP